MASGCDVVSFSIGCVYNVYAHTEGERLNEGERECAKRQWLQNEAITFWQTIRLIICR